MLSTLPSMVSPVSPSIFFTATVEYSSDEAASILLSSQSTPSVSIDVTVPMDPDTIDLVIGSMRMHTGTTLQLHAYLHLNTPYFPEVCFDFFVPGHRKPNCPHLIRSALNMAYLKWVVDKFIRLDKWT